MMLFFYISLVTHPFFNLCPHPHLLLPPSSVFNMNFLDRKYVVFYSSAPLHLQFHSSSLSERHI